MANSTCNYLLGKEVLNQGWMVKAPPEKKMKKKTGIAKVITYMNCTSPRLTREEPARLSHTKWHRRYFVLFKPKGALPDEYLLEYFQDQNCSKKKGYVDLKHCSEIAAFDQTLQEYKIEFVLSLKTLDRNNKPRMYYLSCESEEDMNRWVEYLTTVCRMVIRSDDDHDFIDPSDNSLSTARWLSNSADHSSPHPTVTTPNDSGRRMRGDSADSLSHHNDVFSLNSLNNSVNQIPQDQPPRVPPPNSRPNGVNSRREPSNIHRGPVHTQQCYDTLPTSAYQPDSGMYHVLPPRSEEYYNMTGGQADNVYQIPPEMSGGQNPHEYINLTQTGQQAQDDDVYRMPPERSSSPPPPVPRRTVRKSFVRKNENGHQPRQQSSVYNYPPPRQTSSVYNVPPPAPQQRGYPPASPTADQQHEYLNLWSGAETGTGFSEEKMPKNINDVPPLVPPLPHRLRNRDPNKSSSTSSSSSSTSSSSRSTRSSSSGQQMIGPTIPVEENPGGMTEPSSNLEEVSYIRAEDLFFGSKSNESNRPASLTEYNELDKVKTRALALLAEDISKNNK